MTPARRDKEFALKVKTDTEVKHRKAKAWAQRLNRVIGIDIETCSFCGGYVKVVASIENPVVIRKILLPLKKREIDIANQSLLLHLDLFPLPTPVYRVKPAVTKV